MASAVVSSIALSMGVAPVLAGMHPGLKRVEGAPEAGFLYRGAASLEAACAHAEAYGRATLYAEGGAIEMRGAGGIAQITVGAEPAELDITPDSDSIAAQFEALAAAILAVELRVLGPPLVEGKVRPWIHTTPVPELTIDLGGRRVSVRAAGPQRTWCRLPSQTQVFLLSAGTADALAGVIDRLLVQLEEVGFPELARRYGRHAVQGFRLAVCADGVEDLRAKLTVARPRVAAAAKAHFRIRNGVYFGSGELPGKVAMLFPGQGSQFPGMLRELCLAVPGVREWFDHLDAAFVRQGQTPPSRLLEAGGAGELHSLEIGGQLGLAASLSMFPVLRAMNLSPSVYAGHSNGEHAALLAAGVIVQPDIGALCDLLCELAVKSVALPPPPVEETMLSVSGVPAERLRRVVEARPGRLYLAIDNCPTQVLLGGHRNAIQEAAAELGAQGGICTPLPFVRAHHTPLFRDWSVFLESIYTGWRMGNPAAQVYCCATARPYPRDAEGIRTLLAAQWSSTVRFRETVEALYAEGVRVFVEAGPDRKLSSFVSDTLRGRPHWSLAASANGVGEMQQLLAMAGELYAAGVDVKVDVLSGVVPAMPVASAEVVIRERHREMLELVEESRRRIEARLGGVKPVGERWPLLGEAVVRDGMRLSARRRFDAERDPVVRHHALGREGRGPGRPMPVIAFTMAMEIVAEAANRLTGLPVAALRELRAHAWLALDAGLLTVETEATVEGRSAGGATVRVRLFDASAEPRTLAFEGVAVTAARRGAAPAVPSEPASRPAVWNAGSFYRDYAFHGPAFQGLRDVFAITGERAAAELTVTALPGLRQQELQLDPALLDCAGQLAAFWFLEHKGEKAGAFPFAAAQLEIFASPAAAGAVVQCKGAARHTAFDTLVSDFDFCGADGKVMLRLTGFEQRVIRFAAGTWDLLFGQEAFAPGGLLTAERDLLTRNSGIWGRALANFALPPAELRRFYEIASHFERGEWLLRRLTANSDLSFLTMV